MEILTNYVKDIEHQMKEMTHEAQKMSTRRPIWSCILCQGITIPRLKGVPYWCSQYVKISYVINVTSWGLPHNVLNVTPREITYQSLEGVSCWCYEDVPIWSKVQYVTPIGKCPTHIPQRRPKSCSQTSKRGLYIFL